MAPWGEWTPESHALFPPRVRADIFTLFLLRKRLAWPVPKDLVREMIQWLATRDRQEES